MIVSESLYIIDLTQPAASKHAEASIGTPIFRRHPRKNSPIVRDRSKLFPVSSAQRRPCQ